MSERGLPTPAPASMTTPAAAPGVALGGVVTVTPNHRLAVALLRAHRVAETAAGSVVWETPDILPLATFTERLWATLRLCVGPSHGDDLPDLMPPEATAALWERVLDDKKEAASDTLPPLLSVAATAKQAAAAWRLAYQWRLMDRIRHTDLTDDARVWLGWAVAYHDGMRARRSLDGVMLTDRLCDLLSTLDQSIAARTLPSRLVVHGFDLMTPQVLALMQAFEAAGVEVVREASTDTPVPSTRMRVEFATNLDETRAAARWAYQQVRQLSHPGASVAVVLPGLEARRDEVRRTFNDVFADFALAARDREPETVAPEFNVSLGIPLGNYAPVCDALNLLQLGLGAGIGFNAISGLLLSPWIAGESQDSRDGIAHRAILEAQLRDSMGAEIRIDALDALFRSWREAPTGSRRRRAADGAPMMLNVIASVAQWQQQLPRQAAAPSDWRDRFAALLDLAGFPGGRALDSHDYQVWSKWRETLARLARLQSVIPRMTGEEALRHLRQIAAESVFQPESQASTATVQVLGMLEAAGQTFDALWVAGLTDAAWPLPSRPDAFIPVVLQRAAGVPDASPDAALALDRRIMARWADTASTLVLSHAVRASSASDEAFTASVLARELVPEPMEIPVPWLAADARTEAIGSIAMAAVTDVPLPPLPVFPKATRVAGGSAVLQDVAACPFRALARHRLGARALETPSHALDQRERGALLHRVLALAWGELGRHAVLVEEMPTLPQRVKAWAETAVHEAAMQGAASLTGRFADIEVARLTDVALAWLAMESERPGFEVTGIEQQRRVVLGGLEFDVRIDRQDRLGDGTAAITDYKTGLARASGWMGERPDAPQLPLYAVTNAEPVTAVAFGILKRGPQFGFVGLARDEGKLPKVKTGETPWDDMLQGWGRTLDALVARYVAGDSAVDPKAGNATCKHCDLKPLCRVAEIGGVAPEEDTEGEGHGNA